MRTMTGMAWLWKKKDRNNTRKARQETVEYLRDFCATRSGVAGYYEAETPHDPSSLVLVAYDGEWTRRKVPDMSAAQAVARELRIELYDVASTGYPRAMREWTIKNPGKDRYSR